MNFSFLHTLKENLNRYPERNAFYIGEEFHTYAEFSECIRRVYGLLGRQWTDYLQYLKSRYPFLFSLALRTNPFVEKPSPVVR